MTWEHGASAYRSGLCRCPVCTGAQATRVARERAERFAARELVDGVLVSPVLRQHGTENGYMNWGCRCTLCSLARSRARQRRGDR